MGSRKKFRVNKFGRALANYILNHTELSFITTQGLVTYTHVTYRGASTLMLDLTLSSNNFVHIRESNQLAGISSDHCPILTTVKIVPDTTVRNTRQK